MPTTRVQSAVAGFSLIALGLVFDGVCGASDTLVEADIDWERLRPLDNNPKLDSGQALNRACVPGETVVVRVQQGIDSASGLGLHQGQFVVCIANTRDAELEVVDGPGTRWSLKRNEVNATTGFPSNWAATDRDYLVWAYGRNTLVFRESLNNSYEGNFFYLLLDTGADGSVARGMLVDSGTGYADLKPYILPLIEGKPLIVVSTHSHWDHFGGHRHFIGLDNVTLLGYQPDVEYSPYPKPPEYDIEALKRFFGLDDWPARSSAFWLGNRKIEILPMPGHTSDSIAVYDYEQELLLTGDTLYPGLLFVESWQDFSQSLARLEEFVVQHPVKWLLGGHVEMSTQHAFNGKHEYFFFGTNTHSQEHPLNMPVSYAAKARSIVNAKLKASEQGSPRYDARVIDQQFHSVPLVPVPFPGIPAYYRLNAQRLVDQLIQRHGLHDQDRRQ